MILTILLPKKPEKYCYGKCISKPLLERNLDTKTSAIAKHFL